GGVYCAWHSAADDGSGHTVSYTDLPYQSDMSFTCGGNAVNGDSRGALDGVSIVAGHEYAETVTDPVPSSGWVDDQGAENADKCAWLGGDGGMQDITLSTGRFAIQGLWSNAAHGCAV